MVTRFGSIIAGAWGALIILLSLQISAVSVLRYLAKAWDAPPPILANAFATPFLTIHVAAAVVMLLLGPLQFVRRIRERMPAFHRATGRLYVGACAIGTPAGLVLAFGSSSGVIAGSGFAMLAVLSMAFTWLGWRAAVERRFGEHRAWMIRSYAMTAAAITLRIMLPLSLMAGIAFSAAYPVIAWLSWMVNLALVEMYLRRGGLRARGAATLAAA